MKPALIKSTVVSVPAAPETVYGYTAIRAVTLGQRAYRAGESIPLDAASPEEFEAEVRRLRIEPVNVEAEETPEEVIQDLDPEIPEPSPAPEVINVSVDEYTPATHSD